MDRRASRRVDLMRKDCQEHNDLMENIDMTISDEQAKQQDRWIHEAIANLDATEEEKAALTTILDVEGFGRGGRLRDEFQGCAARRNRQDCVAARPTRRRFALIATFQERGEEMARKQRQADTMDCAICDGSGQQTEATKVVLMADGSDVYCCDDCAREYEPYMRQKHDVEDGAPNPIRITRIR